MAPNVYTKNEILQNLASKGYFIDAYTLDTFFKKWRVDAIFEDQNGHEFFDKNALDLVLTNLFSNNSTPQASSEQVQQPVQQHVERTIQQQAQAPNQTFVQNVQSNNQAINQSVNQSVEQPVKQSVEQPQAQQVQAPINQQEASEFQNETVSIQNQPSSQTQEVVRNAQNEAVQVNNDNSISNFNVKQEDIELISMEEDQNKLKAEQNEQPQEINPAFQVTDKDAVDILNNISLSDGTSLMDKINSQANSTFTTDTISQKDYEEAMNIEPPKPETKSLSSGILAGAMQQGGYDEGTGDNDILPVEVIAPVEQEPSEFSQIQQQNGQFQDTVIANAPEQEADEDEDFDDISLLSESLEAQEKLREYVVSELSKKNIDVTPKNGDFNIDANQKMLSMVAKAMAKKVVAYINASYAQDAKAQIRLTLVQEEYKKLDKKAKELEEKNKKLKLLLAESNRNLNSYQKSWFGLYKKVKPSKK